MRAFDGGRKLMFAVVTPNGDVGRVRHATT
jgi:hypothetical protein